MKTSRILTLLVAVAASYPAGAADECGPGVYGASERDRVVLTRPEPGTPRRYLFLDGRRGDVEAADAPVRCEAGEVATRAADGTWQRWARVPLTETPARFRSHDTELVGVLIEPEAQGTKPPLTILVHGSEKTAAIGSAYPYMLAAQGIAVFAYDKRGTGASEGFYTQDFELLADDAVAASVEARRLAAGRFGRFGFTGFSQGGWVGPLAAKRSHADFVAVGYGLMLTPLEEDREQVLSELRRLGYDARTLAHARDVTDATAEIIASRFTHGFDRLATVKRRFGGTPWLARIQGEFTGAILRMDEATLRRIGEPLLNPVHVIWRYDNVALMKTLDAPVLWVIAAEDREAPSDVTRDRLLALRRAGKSIDLYRFPETDHGMYEYVETPDGTRTPTRVTEGYYRLLGDWIRGRLAPPYGRAERLR